LICVISQGLTISFFFC